MTGLYNALLKQMKQKISVYEELIALLRREWDCIVSYSIDDVQEVLNKKEILVLKMQSLEENRLQVVRELAAQLKENPEELTLKRLLETHKHPLNAQLASCRKAMLRQIAAIGELNEKTRHIVDYASISIKKSLSFIHRAQQTADAPYQTDGRLREGKMSCRILSAKA